MTTKSMTIRVALVLALASTIVALGCLQQSRTAGTTLASTGTYGLAVSSPRPALAGEAAFEDTVPLLREPENGNVAPGPNGMVAFMKADQLHHPRLYLSQPAGGDSTRLLIDRYATKPRWAPVGERLACTVWMSRTFPWSLCIVAIGEPDTLYPLPTVNAVRYRWSPDARYLGVSATLPGGAASVLYLVDAQTGRSQALDTLQVYSEYDLGWSPDSRMLAASRPTRLADTEEVLEADIWIYDVHGRRVRAVTAEGRANVAPRWVDNHRLLFTREQQAPQGQRESLIVDLTQHMK